MSRHNSGADDDDNSMDNLPQMKTPSKKAIEAAEKIIDTGGQMTTIAYLNQDSPFHALFPNGIPVKSILSRPADCIGDGVQDTYMVAIDKLTPEQFDEVSALVWEQCGRGCSLEVARKEIKASGLPLRAKHVATLMTDIPFFL